VTTRRSRPACGSMSVHMLVTTCLKQVICRGQRAFFFFFFFRATATGWAEESAHENTRSLLQAGCEGGAIRWALEVNAMALQVARSKIRTLENLMFTIAAAVHQILRDQEIPRAGGEEGPGVVQCTPRRR